MERKFSLKDAQQQEEERAKDHAAYFKSPEYKKRLKNMPEGLKEITNEIFTNEKFEALKIGLDKALIKRGVGFEDCKKVYENMILFAKKEGWIPPHDIDEFAGFYLYKWNISDDGEIVVDRGLFKEFHEYRYNELKDTPSKEGTYREVILAHHFKALAGYVEPKSANEWGKDYKKDKARQEYYTIMPPKNGKNYKPALEHELINIINLLVDFPNAQNLAKAELDKL